MSNEPTIIERVRRGDRDAFGQLVEKYKAAVFAVALHHTRNEKDAEDVAQEVFVKAYTQLGSLRNVDKFASWLFRIAQNACTNWKRAQARKREVALEPLLDKNGEATTGQVNLRSSTQTPAEALEAKEFSARVMQALDTLSETNRLTTMMYYMDGLSYQDIAEFQGVSVSAVKGRLYHARKQLRKGMMRMIETTLGEARLPPSFASQVVGTIQQMITIPGASHLIADIRSIMGDSGEALVGIGHGSGDSRMPIAVADALSGALLREHIGHATGVLVSIAGDMSLTLQEARDAMDIVYEVANSSVQVIFELTTGDDLAGRVRVTLIAIGFEQIHWEGVRDAAIDPEWINLESLLMHHFTQDNMAARSD